MSKIKTFSGKPGSWGYDETINNFIKDKKVIDIKWTQDRYGNFFYTMVLYEEEV